MMLFTFRPKLVGQLKIKIKANSFRQAVKKLEKDDWNVYQITHILSQVVEIEKEKSNK